MMAMTRKHYKAFAELIRDARFQATDLEPDEQRIAWDTLDIVADGMIRIFRADNPRFSNTRFYDAQDVTVQEVNERVAERERRDAELMSEYRKAAPAQYDRSGIPLEKGAGR